MPECGFGSIQFFPQDRNGCQRYLKSNGPHTIRLKA